jgi:HSP20 family molecular chaperone IbpA
MTADDPRLWMWTEACALLERAERLHRHFFEPNLSDAATAWEPPIDVFETKHEIWVIAALPGVGAQDLEVYAEGNRLEIRGQRPLPIAARDAMIRRLEIPHGRFERRLLLPSARLEVVHRELVHGCLVLSLTKQF